MQNGVSTVAPRPAKRYAELAERVGLDAEEFDLLDALHELEKEGDFLKAMGVTL